MMTDSTAMRMAALTGLSGVALGAFGAHALKEVLGSHQMTAVWEKAVFYQFVHAVMLWVLAERHPRGPWWAFGMGILLFSGSLYLLALTNLKWLGLITPLGGVCFIVGWAWLLIAPGPRKDPARTD